MDGAAQRRAAGAYYTPPPVVAYIVEQTLTPLLARGEAPRVLDPACGDGVFLKEAHSVLQTACPGASPLLGDRLFGVDVDARAVAEARRRLAELAAPAQRGAAPRHAQRLAVKLRANIRCGDALIGPDFPQPPATRKRGPQAGRSAPFCWRSAFPQVFAAGGFDAIVGNPPYVNIRLLARTRGPAVRQYLRSRFRCAHRAYDLYVLFVEQALALLRPGGVCGMIVPNKIATLDYALPCRALLLEQTTLHRLTDLSDLRVFPDAGVYPYVLVFEKRPAPADHRAAVHRAGALADLTRLRPILHVRQSDFSAESGFQIHGRLDVESRVATQPLAERATLSAGTTGFMARRIASALREAGGGDGRACLDFIVSGNIDRFLIRPGGVRYMKRLYRRPVLPVDAPELSEGKRRLFRGPKIVLAGMGQRLEAALDQQGLALGVQVYAVSEPQDDLRFLLALLNSKLLSYLFRIRYRAKRLAGNYLAINKGQLAKLPIPRIDEKDRRQTTLRRQLAELASRMISRRGAGRPAARPAEDVQRIDMAIDQLVYRLYDLTDDEMARVEAEFGPSAGGMRTAA